VPLRETFARFVARDGRHYLEPIAGRGVAVDGAPVGGSMALDRRHVLAIGDLEFVYSRSAAAAGVTPAASPPTPPLPTRPSSGTVVDAGGFDVLPDLNRRPSGLVAKPKAPDETPVTAPRPKLNADDDAAASTMFEKGGFDALPSLSRKAPAASVTGPPASPPPAVPPPAPSAPPTPPAAPPPPPPSAARTELFVPPPVTPQLELDARIPDVGAMSFPLKFGDNVLGRSQDCDITVPDPKNWLSRRHAVVRVTPDAVELVDLGGMNGTFVNGNRISTVALTPGARFSLGPHLEFTLRKT
jgi:predicted component of type VI protein secretion system